MIKLLSLFKDHILEGGKVFKDTEYDTANIDQGDIEMTVRKFSEALGSLFPNKKASFAALNDRKNWLGSTGKKQVPNEQGKIEAGDIDLAYSGDNFIQNGVVDLEGWKISEKDYTEKYDTVKSKAKTATEEQMKTTALLRILVSRIEKDTETDLHVTGKSTGGGVLHFSFPQYNAEGKKLEQRAQIDLDTGDLKWLTFRNNADVSYEEEKEGIKRLHRGQLMLAMFSTAGYTFKSGVGLVDKETKKISAGKTPAEAVEAFNKTYKPKQPLTMAILSNYGDLLKYVEANMRGEDLTTTMNAYLRQLEIPNEYIPAHMRKWKADQEKKKTA
jgi:hypothetical protein